MKFKIIAAILIWFVLITVSALWNSRLIDRSINSIVKGQGKSFFEDVLTTRAWNASHGGVYVPVTEKTKPNTFLDTLNREITSVSTGIRYTKINPAYMTRQISEIASEKSFARYRITSLKPIRPDNKADRWETKQLQKFKNGEKESFEYIKGDSSFRYMAPLLVTRDCLQCHKKQAYKLGDIRGGISVTLKAADYLQNACNQKINTCLVHLIIFILGTFVLLLFIVKSSKQFSQIQEANKIIKQKNEILNKHQELLEDTSTQLIKANKTKDQFFSIVAHDLRSPFNSILGFSEILLQKIKEKDYKDIEEYSTIINESASKTLSLLVNLLDWAGLQMKRKKFKPEKIFINEITNSVIAPFESNINSKNIFLKKTLPSDIQLVADKNMINTVIRNLISNAVKYTPDNGKITVSAKIRQGYLEYSVADTGLGIKEENISKIFNLDEIFSTPGTNLEKGTGLGLVLSHEFIKLHNGVLTFESEINKGTTFTFVIPVEQNNVIQ